MFFKNIMTTIAAVLPLTCGAAHADTTFTHQGELKENGDLANGWYNMDFSLWNALSGGNQIGAAVTQNDVQVVGGKFAIEFVFGPTAFDNNSRWMEIMVNGVTLSSRNPVTRVLYAGEKHGQVTALEQQETTASNKEQTKRRVFQP